MFHQKYFNLQIIQDDTLDLFFSLFEKAKMVFFDSETSGLAVRAEGKDYIVGYTFAFEDEVSKDVFYIPIRHDFEGVYKENNRFKNVPAKFFNKTTFPDFDKSKFDGEYYNVDSYEFAQRLKPLMEDGHRTYIAHNIDFDLHAIANEGISIPKVFINNIVEDTQVMVHTVDETVEKNLEAVTKMLFGVEKSHYSEVIKTVTNDEKIEVGIKANANAEFEQVQIPIGGQYSAEDVWFMKQMFPQLVQALKDDGMYGYYKNVRIPYLKVLWKMERKGFRIDLELLDKMAAEAAEEIKKMEYNLYKLAGVEFNPSSGQNLYELLFGFKKKTVKLNENAQKMYDEVSANLDTKDKLKYKKQLMTNKNNVEFVESFNEKLVENNFGFKPVEWTDGGQYKYEELKTPKVGKDELKKLLRQKVSERSHKFIESLVDYKKLIKLKSAFMDGLKEHIYNDGKVHCSFNLCGCLEGNTLIPTDKGLFPIKSFVKGLKDNQPVLFVTKIVNKDLELEDTKYVVKFENVATTKLNLALGMEIEGSDIHPIIVSKFHSLRNNTRFKKFKGLPENEEWRKLQDIKVSDHVVVPYGYKQFAKDYIKLNYKELNLTKHQKIYGKLPEILDEDLAEFMGMYYADGCIADSNGTFTLVFTNNNQDVVNRLDYLFDKLFGIKAHIYKKYNTQEVKVSAKYLTPIEKVLELKRGCVNKVIPDLILKSPESVVKAFIKGLTLDSCVIQEKGKTYLKFTLSNKISAKYLQEILLNIGILSSVRQDKSKTLNVFHLLIYNDWYNKFKKEIGFVERVKYVDCIAEMKSSGNGYMVFDNKLYIRVKSIEKKINDVYDFNVPCTHSFISLPCISHNTDSFRLSCQYVNLQQLPHPLEEPKAGEDRTYFDFWERFEIRKLFIADEGYSVVAADYHALEKFLTAHLSQDKMLIRMMRENLDPHGTVATIVFPELANVNPNDVKKVAPEKRQIAKKIGFAVDYGGTNVAVAKNLEIDRDTAQHYIDKYFEGFSGLHAYDKAVVKFAKQNGYVKTLGGHKRHLWDINSEDMRVRSYLERVAVNVLSQGE